MLRTTVRLGLVGAVLAVLLVTGGIAGARLDATTGSSVATVSSSVVISQVYGGGGNAGAQFQNDFIEVFNRGATAVDVSGWSVQYASASGTTWSVTPLTGMLQPGQYLLVQEAAGTGSAAPLPVAPDVVGTTNLSATSGKVALVSSQTALTDCTTGVIDLVGYGTASCAEGTATPALTNSTADVRSGNGCVDTDANAADFAQAAPAPRNSASTAAPCSGTTTSSTTTTTTTTTSSTTTTTPVVTTVTPGSGGPVISQVYGGGNNSGATYANDYIEVFNPTAAPIDVSSWSVQYASAAGTSWQLTQLTGTLAPGQYLLVQEAATAGGSSPALPVAPDVVGTINLSATNGKVALVAQTTALSGACPAGTADFVGFGTANCSEGSPAPAGSNTTALFRAGNGCVDTNVNSADLSTATPAPRNSSTTFTSCGGGTDVPPTVASTTPANGATSVAASTNVTVTFSEPVTPDAGAFALACATSGSHTLTVTGGPTSWTLNPDVDLAGGESCTLTVTGSKIHDQDGTPDAMAADYTATFTTAAPVPSVAIHDIQGASQVSPLAGQTVQTGGVVTARSTNGFWMQDPSPDADPATSEGVFVFTSSAPAAVVGDAVRVTGRVQEFRPGGATNGNLTTTELSGSPTVTVLSSGNPLPAATIVGPGGRTPPTETIEDDSTTGDVETGNTFDPASDGLDFWESMEGMRVEIDDAVAVGPTQTAFGETPIVSAANAGIRTPRGGVIARANDFNPERVILDDLLATVPSANVGDHFTSPVLGVLDYNFGNFFLEATQTPTLVHDGVTPESTTPQGTNQLAIATFNVENLDPGDGAAKFDRLAHIVVDNLKAPDILAVEEVQDNDGATDSGNVDATVTLDTLTAAIQSAGGPAYSYRLVNPVNDQDGGEPGGNIRVVFLFRTDRGLAFVDKPGATSTTADSVDPATGDLVYSPGRVDPTNTAWSSSRKPLAGEFLYNGQKLFVIANHFNSKGGDDPLMGRRQPPQFASEVQRHQQATLVRDFTRQILAANPNGNVVVLGDLNDFQFSQTVSILKDTPLHDLIETLPVNEQYSYDFEGNSETLDHILLSDALFAVPRSYDIVHVNAEFFDQASDHDPQVVRLTIAPPNHAPTVSAGGPYTATTGGTATLTATGSDPDGDTLTYAWDLDGNGTYETPGQSVTFHAGSTPGTQTVAVQATDPSNASATAQTTVTVISRYDAVCAQVRAASSSPALADAICVALGVAEKQAAAGHRVAAQAVLVSAEVLVRVGGTLHAFTPAEVAALVAAIRAL